MRLSLHLPLFAALFSGLLSQAQIRIGGPNLKSANVHVERGNLLKGKSTIAIAAYRVIFVTEDTTSARGTNNLAETAGGSASSNVSGRLMGLDKPLMQRLTDSIYTDFLEKAKAAGYTVLDSQALASKSPTYKAMPMTENFDTGRWGRYVVPTGQMSVEQANDDSKAVGRGASKVSLEASSSNRKSTRKVTQTRACRQSV